MNQAIGQVLPLAAAVGLSPVPIIAIVVILATPRARVNGPAFLFGWLLGLAFVGVVVLLISGALDATDGDEPATWVAVLLLALGALLVVLAFKQWRGRPRADETAELPAWMTRLDDYGPAKTFRFGALLAGANPKHFLLTVAAAAEIAETGIEPVQETIALIVFILIGTAGVGLPVTAFFALGERSRTLLEEVKSWMTAHNAAIMAAIMLLLGFKLLGDGLSGL